MVLSGMEENKKSASPKKNYAYSLQDKIMFVDRCRWGGHGCDGAAAKKGFSLLCGRKILRPYI